MFHLLLSVGSGVSLSSTKLAVMEFIVKALQLSSMNNHLLAVSQNVSITNCHCITLNHPTSIAASNQSNISCSVADASDTNVNGVAFIVTV